jgi:hypothetical protein
LKQVSADASGTSTNHSSGLRPRADRPPAGAPGGTDPANSTGPTHPPAGLEDLAAVVDRLAAQDLDLPDAVRAERVLELRRLLDRLEGHWLQELAGLDARGAVGGEAG